MNAPSLRERRRHGSPEYPVEIDVTCEKMRQKSVPYHWHNELEWVLVERGALSLTIGAERYDGRPGDVFLIRSGALHEMHVPPGGARYFAVLFPPELLASAPGDALQLRYFGPLAAGRLRFPTRLPAGGEAAAALSAALRRVYALHFCGAGGRLLGVKAALLQAFYDLDRLGLLCPAEPADPGSPAELRAGRQREVLAYLEAHYAEPLSLEELAARFHFSPKYFSAYFRANFGQTLTQYRNALRVEQAALLLLATDGKILDIALRTGFDNVGYFIRLFRRIMGVSPSQYRSRMRPAPRSGENLPHGRESPSLPPGKPV